MGIFQDVFKDLKVGKRYEGWGPDSINTVCWPGTQGGSRPTPENIHLSPNALQGEQRKGKSLVGLNSQCRGSHEPGWIGEPALGAWVGSQPKLDSQVSSA